MPTIDLPELADLLLARSVSERLLLAVAGPPGSGKSTLTEALVARLNRSSPGHAAVMPMDGYHFDDTLLAELGRRERKGAPDTFDVDGLRHTLIRLRENADEEVVVPVFDRDLEIARAGARRIPAAVGIVVVEGNYLLLRHPPWSRLLPLFDVTAMIEVPEAELRERLTRRWQGYALPSAEVTRKVEEVDLLNGRRVMRESVEPDYRILHPAG